MIVKYPLDQRFDHTLTVGPAENVAEAINHSLQANIQMDPTEHIPIPDLRRSTQHAQSRKPAPSKEVLATLGKPPGGNKSKTNPSREKLFELVSARIFPLIFDLLIHL